MVYISALQLFFLTLTDGKHIFVSVQIQLLCLVNDWWFNMVLTVWKHCYNALQKLIHLIFIATLK